MKTLLMVLLSASLAACATDPIPWFDAKFTDQHFLYQERGDETVPVTIVRDIGGFAGQGCSARIRVNNDLVAYLRPGEKVVLHLRPATYAISADTRTEGLCLIGSNVVGVDAQVKSGNELVYRLGFDANGAAGLYPGMNW